jgi:hypothetical protein
VGRSLYSMLNLHDAFHPPVMLREIHAIEETRTKLVLQLRRRKCVLQTGMFERMWILTAAYSYLSNS